VPEGIPQEDFDELDTDKDGFISKAEFLELENRQSEEIQAQFAKCDTKTDGKLTQDEMHVFAKLQGAKHGIPDADFKAIDTDGDSFVSAEEFETWALADHSLV
jgi:hypothetical protein